MTATLPLADLEQVSQREEVLHIVCPDCFPNPQFGELLVALCGKQELFERFVEEGSAPPCKACHALKWCFTCKEAVW